MKGRLDRPGYAILSRNAELSNVENVNGVLKALLSSKARLAAKSEQQLRPLFHTKRFYGRAMRASFSPKKALKR